MARKLTSLSLNDAQRATLDGLMQEDGATSTTAFVVSLIYAERKRRNEEKSRRPVGRPRRDDSTGQSSDTRAIEDEPRNIPHPDQFSDANRGTFMTQSEYDEWLDNHPWHKERLKRQS